MLALFSSFHVKETTYIFCNQTLFLLNFNEDKGRFQTDNFICFSSIFRFSYLLSSYIVTIFNVKQQQKIS